MKFTIYDLRFTNVGTALITFCLLGLLPSYGAENLLITGATVHTVSGNTITNGEVLLQNGKITQVWDTTGARDRKLVPTDTTTVDLKGLHLYPGMIALNTDLGLMEIEAVRATRDDREVGEYTPEVL